MCTSRRQPQGKINKLSVMKLKSVKKFLKQHFDCPYHRANLKKLNEPSVAAAAAGPQEEIECPGLCIAQCREHGLMHYHEEFKLWAAHTNFDSSTRVHKYWQEGSEWWVRHNHCLVNFRPTGEDESTCCCKCRSLSDPSGIQRRVAAFAVKFYAGHLLQKRLFCPEGEAENFLKELESSTFVQNNHKAWQDMINQSNAELQANMRRSWSSQKNSERTEMMNLYMSSVIDPCCSIHVGSVGSNLTTLASQFVTALAANKHSEPWKKLSANQNTRKKLKKTFYSLLIGELWFGFSIL